MSLLPDTASIHEQIEALFVAYRGRGVSLSPEDVELLEAWAAPGVPFEVVARGIRKAAEAARYDAPDGSGQLRSLRAARRKVEAEISKFRRCAANETSAPPSADDEPFHRTRHRKLLGVLSDLAGRHPETKGVLARLEAGLAPIDFEAANRNEDLALALLLRILPFTERIWILRRSRALVEKAEVFSATARRESLRFHRAAEVRGRWDLPAFW